jgi:NADH:ubiquinone reductase (H+-translocating)
MGHHRIPVRRRPAPPALRIHGTPAWLAWLALHLVTLLGGRNRISALVNMSSRYLTWQHGGGLIVGDGMTGLTAPSAPADEQAIGHASTDPAPP